MKILLKIRSKIQVLFQKQPYDGNVEFVDRDEFAQELKHDFKGNTELLKAIEERMNKHVKPHQRVSLTN
jgi:hypothetical protein